MASSPSLDCPRIDDTFGPHAGDCRGGFDFTLLFEESILTIAPLGLLLLVLPWRIFYLFSKPIKVVWNPLIYLKTCSYLAFAALQLALSVLWAGPSVIRTRASIPAAALTFVGFLACCLLSYVEHMHSVRPSDILNAYLFFSLLFDVAHTRTLWLQQYNLVIASVSTSAIALKTIILLLEATEKRRILQPRYKDYPSEGTSGILNRWFFWWLNPLFGKGYSHSIGLDDLFTLDKHLASEYLQSLLHSGWSKVTDKTKAQSLFVVALKCFKWPLLSVVFPRLCLIAFNFCQPFLINSAINLSQEPVNDRTTNNGYGMIGAYILVYVGIAITTGQYQHLTYRAITMMRGALISMLYNKTGDLSTSAVDPTASLTLMSADIEQITNGWQTMHEIWANTLEVALAIYLLQRQLGAACAVPIVVAIFSLFGSLVITSFVISRQALWLEAIEKRITATSAMLGAMKGVKLGGLTPILLTNIQKLRVDELNISKGFRKLLVWNMAFTYFTPIMAPILTFAVFSVLARNNGSTATLDTARVFTSLSLFALLSEPLGSLIMSIATFAGSVGSFARIQAFLNIDVRVDTRRTPTEFFPDDTYSSLRTKASSTVSEKTLGKAGQEKAADPVFSTDAIAVHNASFGYDKDGEPLLHDISMEVPLEKLTMIVGPVGCGKSTLLKALLGEVPTLGGTVELSTTRLAYCGQTSWHMNGTIRDSIVAVGDFDAPWYMSVIRACVLDEDLHQLPRGDQTIIGSNGIALSGGQSQRIALARALYARKAFIILDDILSGLDVDTENRVFHNLLGVDGLLRRYHVTVLTASSSAKRLPYADHIIALGSDGKISEQGTFESLNAAGGYVSSFTLPPPDWAYNPGHDDSDRGFVTKFTHRVLEPTTTEKDIELEANRRTGDTSIYLYYVKLTGWIATIIFVVCITAFIFCTSFPTIWVKWWATANAEAPNENLGYYLGIYSLLGAMALISLLVSCWQLIITMVPRSGEQFHWALLKTVLGAPMSFFSTTDTGTTINRFSQDLQLIDMELPVAALNTFATFVLCIAQVVLIGVASVYAAIAFPICLVSLYLIQRYYLRTSRQIRFLDLEAKSPLYSHFLESLNGLVTVRAFGWQSDLQKRNRGLLDRSQRPFYVLYAIQRWLTLVLDLFVAAIATLLIVLVVKLRRTLSAGYVGVALVNVILFSQSVKLLLTFWTNLETHIGAVARIKNFVDNAIPEDLPTENETPPPSWPPKGALEFKSVSAAYRASEPVVKNVSLSIGAGQKVGICGRTGSGKSSLILSIFRLIDLSGGTITIDGLDISKIPRQELRTRIISVPQESYLLNGNVRLNADPTLSASDEEIIDALKSVELWGVVAEKGGLAADIDALFLSHGQKQLFCLARAMLRSSTILILDEATSSVDAQTDALMQRVIRKRFFKHTIIAVAHKLDTILDFDKIAVLDGGVLVDFDTPDALLSRPSAFSKLYNSGKADQAEDVFSEKTEEMPSKERAGSR